jgi:hypothetical protein
VDRTGEPIDITADCYNTHKSRYNFFNCPFGKAFVDDFHPGEHQRSN